MLTSPSPSETNVRDAVSARQTLPVPVMDLRAQYMMIGEELLAAVREVFDQHSYVLGPKVAEFEKAFATYCDAKHCVAVNSGTSALHLALICAGVGPGDEVITVPMT